MRTNMLFISTCGNFLNKLLWIKTTDFYRKRIRRHYSIVNNCQSFLWRVEQGSDY